MILDYSFIQNFSRSFKYFLQFMPLIFYIVQIRELGWLCQDIDFVLSDPFFVDFDVCWTNVMIEDVT